MTEETQKKISKWFWRIITFPVLLLLFMILLVWAFADIPSFKELENPESKLATQIIAEGGEVLTTFHIENRTYVTYEELSPNVVHAAIATEDARFYRHSGIDFKGLARVLFKTILMRNSSQGGGSTITQQLAKTLYPRSEAHSKIPGAYQVKMVWIKLKEWITAVKLEKNYTKDEIMTMYLNSIFFGSNAYGIRSASETFFGKQPSELTIEEAATLIGMANKPTRYNPALNPDKSLARRNFVIGQMEKAGYIDKHQRDSIREIPIELSYQVLDHNAGRAPYFRDMIRRVMTAKKPHRSDYNQREDFTVDSLAWANSELFGWIESHGTDTPREIWQFGEKGTPWYDAIADAIALRYRLMPYLYSLAGAVWLDDTQMERPLAHAQEVRLDGGADTQDFLGAGEDACLRV